MKFRPLVVTLVCVLSSGWVSAQQSPASANNSAEASDRRPNVIWIIPDDMSANFGCYGETAIETPHVDRLASRGIRFTDAHVTAPVCSTCRSAFITGMYQTTIGAHHHRSGRGRLKIQLPDNVEMIPKLFQDAGYHTSISGWPIPKPPTPKPPTPKARKRKIAFGKTDYNFEWDRSIYDSNDWADREPGQPFFAQLQTKGGKLRGRDAKGWANTRQQAQREFGNSTPIDDVKLPPYYPNHPDVLEDWAAYLDSVRMTDAMVGEVIARLDREGVLENTLVVFMTDHGISHARGKQFLYDEGTHVPLIITGPGIAGGTIRDDVVEHIDIAALSLAAAGISMPPLMQARDILATDYVPRDAVFSARDRCDETVDHIRSVRTKDFRYIRNFLPKRPYLQPCAYKDAKSILIAMRQWHAAGKLDEVQNALFASERPSEELYDLRADPHEIHNLAGGPEHADRLTKMRERLNQWMVDTNDQGRTPESNAMFDSDMKVYVDSLVAKQGRTEQVQIIEDNIDLMRSWAAEGK